MKRRDLLKHAALAAAATATHAFSLEGKAPQDKPPSPTHPIGKIALEEHFLIPDFLDYFAETYPNISPAIRGFGTGILQDLGDKRIDVMDKNHIDYVVLSIAGPGVQVERDATVAKRRAKAANDFLAREIGKRPARYGGFAHLAMQDPADAAAELERCVRDLGFRGAMINGQTNGEYLDLDKYGVFWERAAALDAPVYLLPEIPWTTPPSMPATRSFGALYAVGHLKPPRMPCALSSQECSNVIPKRG